MRRPGLPGRCRHELLVAEQVSFVVLGLNIDNVGVPGGAACDIPLEIVLPCRIAGAAASGLNDVDGQQHVDDLRPQPRSRFRALQDRLATAALRRRRHRLPLARVRVPGQALPRVARLAARLAVLPPAPVRVSTLDLPPFPRPDPLFRRGGSGVRAVLAQPPLQLLQPQLKPPYQLPVSIPLSPQPRDLRVPSPPPRPSAAH